MKLFHYFRSVRLPNLLILGLSFYILLVPFIQNVLLTYDIPIRIKGVWTVLLILIISCLAAAGYLHNDLLDIESDKINNKRGIIGDHISIRQAKALFIGLVTLPIIPAFALAQRIGETSHMYLYLAVCLLLYLYNTHLKRNPFIGNVIIALLCGIVMLIPILAEAPGLAELYIQQKNAYLIILVTSMYYAFFAFYINLIREIVKDVEDIVGDKAAGYRTLPVVLGVIRTKLLIMLLMCVTAIPLVFWLSSSYLKGTLQIVGHAILTVPWLMILFYTWRNVHHLHQYGHISRLLKYYFLSALIYLVLIINYAN